MIVHGAELLAALAGGEIHEAKIVFNDRGAVVGPVSRQHSEMKAEGVSYEDNYRGNALAAMLRPGVLEIRYHCDFDDAAVGRIVRVLARSPAFSWIATAEVTYQGRRILI